MERTPEYPQAHLAPKRSYRFHVSATPAKEKPT
jgi:hypothetical protein